jgi:hypothetical protein
MALSGNERLEVQGVAANGQLSGQTLSTTTQQIANLANLESTQETLSTNAGTAGGTITAAAITSKLLQRSGPTLPFTDTTDTAANIIAALGTGAPIGSSFNFRYQNISAHLATLTGGVGVTVSGISTVMDNYAGSFLVTYSAANTVTMVGINQMPLLADNFAVANTTTNYVSSTALTIPAGLVLDLPAGIYAIHGQVQGSAPATCGILVELTGTAGLALSLCNITGWNYNGSTLTAVTNSTALSVDLANSANAYSNVIFDGTMTISTGGQLNVATAQHTSSTATTSVVTGSYIQALRIS